MLFPWLLLIIFSVRQQNIDRICYSLCSYWSYSVINNRIQTEYAVLFAHAGHIQLYTTEYRPNMPFSLLVLVIFSCRQPNIDLLFHSLILEIIQCQTTEYGPNMVLSLLMSAILNVKQPNIDRLCYSLCSYWTNSVVNNRIWTKYSISLAIDDNIKC